MDPTIPTPTVCSTVTTSSISMQAPPPTAPHLLDISLISAQDLAPVSKSMRTYAVVWIDPSHKLTTRTDPTGHTHPTWNEKLTFRIDPRLLLDDDAAITVEIYTASWFHEVLVGTVRVLLGDLVGPPHLYAHRARNIRFVALQVRRPSGTPQGILNMGISLLKNNDHPQPEATGDGGFHCTADKMAGDEPGTPETNGFHKTKNNSTTHTWRSSEGDGEFPAKPVASAVNGSELCSDIGPSASIVAAELAMKSQPPPPRQAAAPPRYKEETGSSILGELTMEEAREKGYRMRSGRERYWRRSMEEESDLSWASSSRHSRRNSDGGLFSCFVYGMEFTIVCGAAHPTGRRRPSSSSGSSRRSNTKPNEANSD